jgi:hypothetical protein
MKKNANFGPRNPFQKPNQQSESFVLKSIIVVKGGGGAKKK